VFSTSITKNVTASDSDNVNITDNYSIDKDRIGSVDRTSFCS
jgi:hypothetical protein